MVLLSKQLRSEQAESALGVHSSTHNKLSGLSHQSGDNSSDDSSDDGSKDSSGKKDSAAASNARSPALSLAAFVSVVTYAIFTF